MKSDKKMDSGVVKFILLKEIGQAVIDRTLSDEEIRAGFEFCKENCKMDQKKRSLLVSFLIGFVILVGMDQWTKGLAVKF